ncbi:THC0290_0291 family protein [Patiriisocius marinistellae]|uniref:THC0290_0291 family protein n=1 Tax=Patiriisocius marinistellae TaxID=2494560 RepID=UPI00125E0AB2|nr:glutamate dehydrogenase [Patiriisocius marinistellae]
MNTRILLLVLILFAFCKQEVHSQAGFSHEIGVITGPVAFYSDYGIRGNNETNTGNVGFGFGIIHYLNFSYRADCNCYTRDKFFNDHFKVRNELDYHKTNLQHYGPLVADDETSVFSDQLRAVTASTRVIEIGSQLEYFPLSIRDFASMQYRLAPFISFGVHYVNFDPEAESSLAPGGDINSPVATGDKYRNAYQQEGGSTWSVVGSIGVRYKLNDYADIMLDSRWTYYFSDWVDGLNPGLEQNGILPVPENKANDWIYWLNIGYIHYLD